MKRTYFYAVVFLCCALLLAGCTGPASSTEKPVSGSESGAAVNSVEQSEKAPAPTAAASASGPSEDTAEPPADAEPEADAWEQQRWFSRIRS